MAVLRLIQIGMNSADLPGSLRLYSEALGYENAGAQGFWGPMAGIQGLGEDTRVLVWWLVGGEDFFQLEFFNHTRPAQRPLPADWRPCDLGWTRFGIAVSDFERTHAALGRHGVETSMVMGDHGARRVAFRDPYVGAFVEVLEAKTGVRRPNADGKYPQLIYATTSVSDLEAARRLYEDTLGFDTAPLELLHGPEHEQLWNLPGASREGFLVECGSACIEVVRYISPKGRPRRADYRCSDQGVVNVALGSRDPAEVRTALSRMASLSSVPPMVIDNEALVAAYVTDAERELEFLSLPPHMDSQLGFVKAAPFIS